MSMRWQRTARVRRRAHHYYYENEAKNIFTSNVPIIDIRI